MYQVLFSFDCQFLFYVLFPIGWLHIKIYLNDAEVICSTNIGLEGQVTHGLKVLSKAVNKNCSYI